MRTPNVKEQQVSLGVFYVTGKPKVCLKCGFNFDANGNQRVSFLYHDDDNYLFGGRGYTCINCGARHYVGVSPYDDGGDGRRQRGGYHAKVGQ